MWANHIETGDVSLSPADCVASGAAAKVNVLDDSQRALVARIRELGDSFITEGYERRFGGS